MLLSGCQWPSIGLAGSASPGRAGNQQAPRSERRVIGCICHRHRRRNKDDLCAAESGDPANPQINESSARRMSMNYHCRTQHLPLVLGLTGD